MDDKPMTRRDYKKLRKLVRSVEAGVLALLFLMGMTVGAMALIVIAPKVKAKLVEAAATAEK